MRRVWKEIQVQALSCQSQAASQWRQASHVHLVWNDFHSECKHAKTREDEAHQQQGTCLSILWKKLRASLLPSKTPDHPSRGCDGESYFGSLGGDSHK